MSLLWDTLVGHFCRTILGDTLAEHSCGTLLRNTLVGHSCVAFFWDTLARHSCRTLWSDTLAHDSVGHSCGTLLWGTTTKVSNSQLSHLQKMSVSYGTSSKTYTSSLQSEHFGLDFLQNAHVKSPKRAFHTRLLPKFTRVRMSVRVTVSVSESELCTLRSSKCCGCHAICTSRLLRLTKCFARRDIFTKCCAQTSHMSKSCDSLHLSRNR